MNNQETTTDPSQEQIAVLLQAFVDSATRPDDPTACRPASYRRNTLNSTHFAKLFELWDTLFDIECNRPCSAQSMQLFLHAALAANVVHNGSTFKGTWPRALGMRVLSLLTRILVKGTAANSAMLINAIDQYEIPCLPNETGMHAIRRMVADKFFSRRSKTDGDVVDETAAVQVLIDEWMACPGKPTAFCDAYETQRDARITELNKVLDPVLGDAERSHSALCAEPEQDQDHHEEAPSPIATGMTRMSKIHNKRTRVALDHSDATHASNKKRGAATEEHQVNMGNGGGPTQQPQQPTVSFSHTMPYVHYGSLPEQGTHTAMHTDLPPDMARQAQQAIDNMSASYSPTTTLEQLDACAGKLAAILHDAKSKGLRINLANTPARLLHEASKYHPPACVGQHTHDLTAPEPQANSTVQCSPLPHHFVGGAHSHARTNNTGNPSQATMGLYAQHAPVSFTPHNTSNHTTASPTHSWLANPLTASPAQLATTITNHNATILGAPGPDIAQPFSNGTGMPPPLHTSVTPSRFIAPSAFFAPADFLKSDSTFDYEFLKQESLDLIPVLGGGYRLKQQMQPGAPPSSPMEYLQACDRMQEWAFAHGRFSLQDVREHSRFVRAIIELNDRWSSPWASRCRIQTGCVHWRHTELR